MKSIWEETMTCKYFDFGRNQAIERPKVSKFCKHALKEGNEKKCFLVCFGKFFIIKIIAMENVVFNEMQLTNGNCILSV